MIFWCRVVIVTTTTIDNRRSLQLCVNYYVTGIGHFHKTALWVKQIGYEPVGLTVYPTFYFRLAEIQIARHVSVRNIKIVVFRRNQTNLISTYLALFDNREGPTIRKFSLRQNIYVMSLLIYVMPMLT